MKRKILSLALVLMMVISMIPMGAFAAVADDANQHASKMSVDKTSVTADGSSEIEFTIYTYNSSNNAVAADVIIASSRGTTDTFTIDSATGAAIVASGTTRVIGVTTGATGTAKIKMTSSTAGTAKVGFYLASSTGATVVDATTNANAVKILNGVTDTSINATNYKQIGTQDVTFTADSINALTLSSVIGYEKKDVKTATAGTTSPKANNINYWELQVQAKTTGGSPVAGEKVEFTADSTNVTFDNESVTTDGAGIAKVKVYATKAGDFKITAKTGSKTLEWASATSANYDTRMKLNFLPSGATDLVGLSDQNQKIAVDQAKNFKIKVLDSNGNQYKINNNTAFADVAITTTSSNYVKVEVVKEPSGSSLSLATPAAAGDSTAASGKYTFNKSSDNLRFNVNPKKEGDYVVKIYLENGKKIEYKFTAVKQGTVTGLNYVYTQTIVPYGKTVEIETLDKLDANGVAVEAGAQTSTDFYFSTSDASVATVGTNGVVYFADDKDNVGKKVTVTATYKTNKLSASYTMTAGGKLANIKAVAPAASEVGKDSAVKVKYVDNKGNDVGFKATASVDVDAYVLEKPAGAIIGTEASSSFAGDMDSYGAADYLISSNKAGTVKVQLIVTMPDGTKLSDVVTLNFGASTATTPGAKAIILTIGSTVAVSNGAAASLDLAPFIKDGRTFIPVSFVTAQLGGKADFTKKADGTVDTVTVTVGGTVATIKIGSTEIKVVKDGKETTVTSDVAAFIKAGRTVLPFRALADAIGAKASYGMKADNSGVEWVKFEQ